MDAHHALCPWEAGTSRFGHTLLKHIPSTDMAFLGAPGRLSSSKGGLLVGSMVETKFNKRRNLSASNRLARRELQQALVNCERSDGRRDVALARKATIRLLIAWCQWHRNIADRFQRLRMPKNPLQGLPHVQSMSSQASAVATIVNLQGVHLRERGFAGPAFDSTKDTWPKV